MGKTTAVNHGSKEKELAKFRTRFPGAAKSVYMNVAARGLLSKETRKAVDDYIDTHEMGTSDKPAMFRMIEETRERFARLINAAPEEVAFTKNISDGLNMVAASYPWKAGDNVVIVPELEHANNFYPWLNLRAQRGIEIKSLAGDNGHMPIDAIIDAIDSRTRIVSVSTVSFSPGFRTRLEPIGEACRKKDVLLLVDGAQSIGIVDTDVKKLKADALVTSTQKGVCGFYGMGFLYCRNEWAERIAPAYLARFGVDLGNLNEAAMAGEKYKLMPAAKRFDLGNYNFLGAVAANTSIQQILDVGTPAIEAHVVRLTRRLADGLLQLGLPVCGGPSGPHLAGIVSVGKIGTGHDASEDPTLDALYRHLNKHGVKLSIRRGMLRFALHAYNNDADVEKVLDLTRAWQSKR